jgi:hypothetical protein
MQASVGVQLTFPVSWPAQVANQASSGTVTIVLLQKQTADSTGTHLTGTVQTCSTHIPDLVLNAAGDAAVGHAGGDGKVQIQLLNSMFKNVTRTFATTGTVTAPSGGSPWDKGAVQAFAPTVGLLGLKAGGPNNWDNPSTAWPPYCANNCTAPNAGSFAASDIVNEDGTNPGLTGTPETGPSGCSPFNCVYYDPPVQLGAGGLEPEADVVQIVSRNEFTVTGTKTDCTHGKGTVKVGLFQNHVISCHVAGGGACTSAQVGFLDQNSPVYTPSDGTVSVVQLTADLNGTCDQALAAQY